jgi:YVTN family beta-propeller protein
MESCDGRMHQPCYKGPIGTGGVGICKGGFRDCTWDTTLNDWTIWGECVGMILPTAEICGNNIDDNCDGIVDENCQTRECLDEEICGNNIDDNCDDYIDENCSYDVVREECLDEEICNNGFDDNCDGNIDENCSCGELTELDCFASDPSMLNHGETSQCKKGVMYCVGGENWGSCQNQVLPSVELCDGIDNDCDGIIDNNAIDGNLCGGCDGEVLVEICGNNIDDNCDGIIDENCPSSNCVNPTVEICDGVDNDCDGFIDEGVLNSCGKCDDSCYEIVIGNDNTNTCIEGSDNYPNCLNNINDDFNDGELDGIGVDPDDPTKLTLDSSTIENDYIWIANSADDTVTKINTKTRLVEGTFPVGDNPSRTAVERDGSVWVANRDSHNVTKLNADGTFAFNVDLNVNCAPRGVAIDRNGNAWIGCYALRGTMGLSDGDVYKVSPSGTIFTGYPYATGVPIYGLAIDSRGYLWSSRLSDAYAGTAARTVLKIDTNKNPGEFGFFKAFSFNDNFQSYGIVVGQNDHVWYAGWNDSGIKELIYDENTDSVTVITHPFTGGGAGRGIATDSEGNIWCAFSTTDRVGKFDSSGNQLGDYPSKGSAPIGIGVDSEDQVWVINNASSSGQAVELNQDGVERGRQNTGTAPYSYSDLTGFNLRNIVSPSGSFKTIIDTQRTDAIYDSISWIGSTPNGSTIKIRARVSNNRNYFLLDDTDVNSPEWSNFVLVSGQPLTWPSGNKPSGRYIQIEVVMTIGATNEDKPSLSNINVNWQRP